MRRSFRLIFSLLLILTSVNILIFVFRDKGFEYVKYADKSELYSSDIDSAYLKKWDSERKKFSQAQLAKGYQLLKDSLGIDTIYSEIDKVRKIASLLFEVFSSQIGIPQDSLNRMDALEQYIYLLENRDKQLWCGHFQQMFGFFIMSAGFVNRYVELVPRKNVPVDFHEVNEVYLPGNKSWIMVDVTRNRLITFEHGKMLSAAEYWELKQAKEQQTIQVIAGDSVIIEHATPDHYFNKNYFLRYYHSMDLKAVYSIKEKLKRYIWQDSWYQNYDPQHRHSNLLFRIKQLALFLWIASLILILLLFHKLRNRKHRTR